MTTETSSIAPHRNSPPAGFVRTTTSTSPSNPTRTHGVGFCGGQTGYSSPTPPQQRKGTLKPTSKQWKMPFDKHYDESLKTKNDERIS